MDLSSHSLCTICYDFLYIFRSGIRLCIYIVLIDHASFSLTGVCSTSLLESVQEAALLIDAVLTPQLQQHLVQPPLTLRNNQHTTVLYSALYP